MDATMIAGRAPTDTGGSACGRDSVHSAPMSRIVLRDLTKTFGDLAILDPLSLAIESGSFVSVIGPSGCGKTTLVRVIAGLEPATAGEVAVDGGSPRAARSHKRVAMVPQQPGLLPWRTVYENARLLLDVNRGANPPEATEPTALLHEVGLGDFLDAYPHELSGGMQQRLALAQSLIREPEILLLDEPFGALDPGIRADMHELLLSLWERKPFSVFMVTHDIQEGFTLGTRLLVFDRVRHDPQEPDAYGARVSYDLPLKPASKRGGAGARAAA